MDYTGYVVVLCYADCQLLLIVNIQKRFLILELVNSLLRTLSNLFSHTTNDREHFMIKKMHLFSTVEGFVEIIESLMDMIKFIANKPSAGIFYVQQHTHTAVPNLINLTIKIEGKSRQVTWHTAASDDSIVMVRSMKELGFSIANEVDENSQTFSSCCV